MTSPALPNPRKRPEREEFFALFFPELHQSNLKADKDAYTRLATASCEAILSDFIRLFDRGYAVQGPGALVIRLHGALADQQHSAQFLSVPDIQADLELAERTGDTAIAGYLRDAVAAIESANVNKCVVLMLIDNSSTRVFLVDRDHPAGGIRDALESLTP